MRISTSCIQPAEVYSEPCQELKLERFAKIVNSFQKLTNFAKRSILHVWEGSKDAAGSDR